jgi:hypothetical protein
MFHHKTKNIDQAHRVIAQVKIYNLKKINSLLFKKHINIKKFIQR